MQPLPQEEVPENSQEGAEIQAGQGVPKVLPDEERREFFANNRICGNLNFFYFFFADLRGSAGKGLPEGPEGDLQDKVQEEVRQDSQTSLQNEI